MAQFSDPLDPRPGDRESPPPADPDHAAHIYFLDPSEGRPVNPNTPEGELRNIAAFAAGVNSAPPLRRAITKLLVWLVLIGIGLAIIAGVANGFHAF